MSGVAFAYEVSLRHLTCGSCGIKFAVDDKVMSERESNGGTWYCPNGHPRIYSESTEKKLEKQLAAEKQARWAAEQKHALAVADLQKASKKLLRAEKRIKNGVCPCCTRHFSNLQRHIATQHPDFATEVKL